MTLQRLSRKEIDLTKWDATVLEKGAGRMYFLSAYLDVTCKTWDALVYGDYEIIMPIPHSIFLFFIQRYDLPLFTQQLGIIGLEDDQDDLKNLFIQKSQGLFRGYFYSYCHENNVKEIKGLKSNVRTNFELDLNHSYEDLKNNYSDNLIRNLKKANGIDLGFRESTDFNILKSFVLNHSKKDDPSPRKIEMIKGIHSIYHKAYESNIYSVWSSSEPLAICLAPKFQNRITLLIPRSSEEGRVASAMAFLIDRIIQTHAGSEMILDFEGSMLLGVAKFYKGFGAVDRPYTIVNG